MDGPETGFGMMTCLTSVENSFGFDAIGAYAPSLGVIVATKIGVPSAEPTSAGVEKDQ